MGLGHTAQACAKASMADFSQSWIATTRLRPTFSARTAHVWVHVAEPDPPLPFLGQLHELEEGSKSHTTEIAPGAGPARAVSPLPVRPSGPALY